MNNRKLSAVGIIRTLILPVVESSCWNSMTQILKIEMLFSILKTRISESQTTQLHLAGAMAEQAL